MKLITKNIQWSVFVFLIFCNAVSAQIKIGDNPTVINSSAIMEIESENKGFLLPRLQLINVSEPAPLPEHVAGMIIYNTATATGLSPGFYYNDGTKWIGVSQSTASGLLSADNGLNNVNGVVKLGGNLTQPTVLTTTAINTLAIRGLGIGDTVQGDFVVIDQITGELKIIPYSVIENILDRKVDSNPRIIPGIKTKIAYDEKGLVIDGDNATITDIQGLQIELNKKAPTESPLFTGTPKTIPINITSSENSIVNKSYVDDEIRQAKISVVDQNITDGQVLMSPSENAVYDALALKAPIDSPTFTGVARAVSPTGASDNKTIATKEYVDAVVAQAQANVVSQSVLLNNTTTAPSEDAVRKELDLKAPLDSPVFTGTATVPDIITRGITDSLAITNKGYVDSQIILAGNIYTKDGTLTDNRKVIFNEKTLDFIGNNVDNPTRLAPEGNMTVGGDVNINNKVAGTNAPINALKFTNDENGVGYSAASISAETGDDKGKGQLSFKVKTATGVDIEAVRITDKGNVLVGSTTDDNTALLNVQSTTKGILMPRQTEAQRNAISTPTTGLQVYQTDVSVSSQEGQYLKTSTGWSRMLLEGDVKLDYYDAVNNSGVTISGSATIPVAVHITGVDASNNNTIAISDAGTSTSARFDGVIIDNVPAGSPCKVYLRYISQNIDTSAYLQNASVFLGTGGGFTHDPSSLPFGVRIGKVFNVSSLGSVLFSAYLVADVLRNQFEQTNAGIEETVFRGPVASGLAPLGDDYLANKKYVDETVANLQLYQGVWDASANLPTLEGPGVALKGWTRDVTVASGVPVTYTNLCSTSPINILNGDVIKFDGTCWVVLEKQYPSATTTQEGMVKLDTGISASTSLVPTSSLLKSVSDATMAHATNINNPHGVTKEQVGLGNVDNTSDANKPVSGPQQTALNLKADKTNGASQITDSNAYANIGTLAGVTQAAINAGINIKLAGQTQLNGTGLVRMAGTAVSYDNTAYAPLASPVFTGNAQAVTASFDDDDTSIATTSFVNRAAVGLWSKNGNNIIDTDFIGSINNVNLVFKAFNIERMRIDNSLAQVNIGATSNPTKLRINTTSEVSKNDAFKIITNDSDPLIMAFQAFGAGTGPHYFDISAFTQSNIPANISMLSEGGILSVGKDDFTGLSEKVEVNGNVRATGFKIPSGTSSQFLMADGTTSIGSFSNQWSLNGNILTTGNFIGSTNNFDIIFKTNDRERWRMGSDTGRFYIGDVADPNSGGSLYIVPEGGTTNSVPLTIKTADLENPLTMEFQTKLKDGSKYFDIRTYIGDNTLFTPANLSLLSEGGILNLGFINFDNLTQKVEVNGYVRATGFKTPGGTASQFLMADGSVSSGGGGASSGLVIEGGVDNTLKPIKDASNNVNTGLYVSSKSVTSYGSANANNTAFGQHALAQAAQGRFNTAVGYNTLYNITSGENNTAIGYSAGSGSNVSNSIYIGAFATSSVPGALNEIVIGARANGNGTNTTTIGDSNTTTTYLRGTVYSNGAFASTSDERLKTNITKVENGLADVMKLHPVLYDKKKTLASNSYDLHEIGFIAQDLQKIFSKGVVFEGTDKDKILSVNYAALIPVLTKAIQEQQKTIEQEKAKNDKQQKEIDELKEMVKQLIEKKSLRASN
ncbi:tail fiber domain-containing protein [Flavobacterium granuli]|uniref:Peptidase S74 domain-containing protein n=1 Tax=Flavobacterium granuli TaxID=280093 RepID=A0ABU1S4J2_9FLAO|nr:tail fiber domain-containing protein [Flavobacterium granuli]MDR6845928.1 hypothetical protein [Flavobacterium granuli]